MWVLRYHPELVAFKGKIFDIVVGTKTIIKNILGTKQHKTALGVSSRAKVKGIGVSLKCIEVLRRQ